MLQIIQYCTPGKTKNAADRHGRRYRRQYQEVYQESITTGFHDSRDLSAAGQSRRADNTGFRGEDGLSA